MKYTYLGRSGLKVSSLCLGTYNFGTKTDETEAFAIMDAALEAGMNFFDTANHYPDFVNCGLTESIIGRWFMEGNNRRERVILATKVYQPMMDPADGPNNEGGLSKYKIIRHVEGSLKRLQTDYIDLYQMHHIDRRTPWEEIWEAFEILSIQGKIRYVGSSNFPGWCLAIAQEKATHRHLFGLISEQHKYNLLCRQPELEVLPAARHLGIGVLAYSPLAGGRLACKQIEGQAGSKVIETLDKNQGALTAFSTLCKELDDLPENVAQAWILNNTAVSCTVCGPRTKKHIEQSLRVPNIVLDDETIMKLDVIFPGPGGAAPEAYAW
jgi:aryl-alcohol dehydrogenase-like predicted oxidoreductase